MRKFFYVMLLSIFVLSPFSFVQADQPAMTFEQPTYKTEVKVKLLPTKIISTNFFGKYAVKDFETDSWLQIENITTMSFEFAENKIVAKANGETFYSSKGFGLYEQPNEQVNYVEMDSIQQSSGTSKVKYRGSFSVVPESNSLALYNTLDMESYLKGVVPSEMPASWSAEAVKAQAVASRSYAYVQMQRRGVLQMTIASQVYGGLSREHALSNAAIDATSGIYAMHTNRPIEAVFHSSSGGFVENSETVWQSNVPYLRLKEDPFDKHSSNPHYGWITNINTSTIKTNIGLKQNEDLVGLKVSNKTDGGAVQQVEATIFDSASNTISKKPLTVAYPDLFRSFFGGAGSLKSTKFEVNGAAPMKIVRADGTVVTKDFVKGMSLQRRDNSTVVISQHNVSVRTTATNVLLLPTAPLAFTFTGNGWGHGLGLSQWGARGMAEAGFTYEDILKHYYTGIELKTLD